MSEKRVLTDGEIEMLSSVFGEALDYSRVRIKEGGTAPSSGFSPFERTIFIGNDVYFDDYSAVPNLALQGFFVHEAAHIMQSQNGTSAFWRGIGPQLSAVFGGREEVYDYTDKLSSNIPFEDWNIEEQASYFEDLYKQRVATNEFGSPIASIPSLGTLQSVDTSAYPGVLTGFAPTTSISPTERPECFLFGTLIDMWPNGAFPQPNTDGTYDEHRIRCGTWQKPIEDIESGDIVVSYDANGNLQPGMVTQIFKNKVRHVLDFWGIGITPGHATLCGAGEFEGQHVPIMDILRTDGAIVRDDGTLVRAATCCEVGSEGDQFVHVIVGDKQPDGRIKIKEHAELRLGTRIILHDGQDVSLQDVIEAKGGTLTEDGYVQDQNGVKLPFWWTYGESLPKPEDYILKRSDVELEAIYIAGEWESIGTQLTAPADRLAYHAGHKPSPNIPPAFKDRLDAPRAVSVLKPH